MIAARCHDALVAAVLVAACAACGDRSSERDVTDRGRPDRPARRFIEPPVGTVRPLPPHLISSSGVGPYHLGDRLFDLMQQLPSGPSMALFEIPGVLHRSLVRAEEGDSVLVGGEPGSLGVASFIAVVDSEVARTESGLHVGSTRDEVAAIGPPLIDLDRARDPRIVSPPAPKGVKLVFARSEDDGRGDSDKDVQRVAAIVITNEPARLESSASECKRPVPSGPIAEIRAGRMFGACLTGSSAGEIVQLLDGELVIRAPEGDKPFYSVSLPSGLQFVAPIRIDGRDELVFVVRSDQANERSWSVYARRFEAGKLAWTVEPKPAYTITAANARWIGVELRDVDLLLEIAATKEGLSVSGLLVTRVDAPQKTAVWRDVVVISEVALKRRPPKPAPSEGSGSAEGSARAPVPDGGSPNVDDAGSGDAP